MVGHNLNETLIQLIARKAVGGKAALIHKSITENGNYDPADEDPPVDGYNYVSVSVETYEDELAQALADLAAAQAELAEAQAEAAALKDCRDAIISKIQEYKPSFDPQTCEDIEDEIEKVEEVVEDVAEEVGADPTDPTYPDNVLPAVQAAEGYTFPTGTEYNDIVSIVGDAYVTDETLGITLIWRYTRYGDYGANGWEAYYVQNGEEHYITASYNSDRTCIMTFKSIKVTDPTTGKLEILWDYTYHGSSYTWHESTYPTVSALIGSGTSGHTYSVKNSGY